MSDNIHFRSLAVDSSEFRFKEAGDGLTISGWITRFNEPAQISDWMGDYLETIAPGSYTKTLRERGPAKVKLMFDHGHDPMLGSLPQGVWTLLEERKQGVWGEGRLLDSWHTIPVRAAIEAGALDGMSVRMRVIAEEMRVATKPGDLDHRTITEVSLLEAGPVCWPAVAGTTVGIRSAALELCRTSISGPAIVSPVVTPAGDTLPPVAGAPAGVTRIEMRRMALSALGVTLNDHKNRSPSGRH